MADPPLRLGKEALERLATFHDEGVVALLDALVEGREQRALRDQKRTLNVIDGYQR